MGPGHADCKPRTAILRSCAIHVRRCLMPGPFPYQQRVGRFEGGGAICDHGQAWIRRFCLARCLQRNKELSAQREKFSSRSPSPRGKQTIMDKCEIVVEVGAEGSAITSIGTRRPRGWTFSRSVNENIDEDSFVDQSAEVDSWQAALRLLDKYRWQTLYPLKVHPEFRARVWVALQERLAGDESKLEKWRNFCSNQIADPGGLEPNA
jgi:hypothetical protein